jgi:integrase/recombinase XerD
MAAVARMVFRNLPTSQRLEGGRPLAQKKKPPALVPVEVPAEAAGWAEELAAVPTEIRIIANADEDAVLIRRWLRAHAPGSAEAYMGAARTFFARVRVDMRHVTVPMVQDYQAWLQAPEQALGPASIHKHLSALKSLFRYAMDSGFIRTNPVALGVGYVPQQPPFSADRILSREEIAAMVRAAGGGRNGLIIRCIYQTGLRREEIAGLLPENIRHGPEGWFLRVKGKGGLWGDVPLVDEGLAEELRAWARQRPAGEPLWGIGPKAIYKLVKRAVKDAAGVNPRASTHWLRHASGSHGRDAGESLESIQRRLRHKRLDTTLIYVHPEGGRVPNLVRDLGDAPSGKPPAR